MMTTALLLACAALCTFVNPFVNHDEFSWKELLNEISVTTKDLQNHTVNIFVKNLKVNGQLKCEDDFFCQAEQELREKVSRLSGKKFNHFHNLIRNLHRINKPRVKTCKPFDKNSDEILLHEFMDNLKRCVQKKYGRTPK
ncbi:interleukin-13 [Xyrauchen texanus]|uniref:interleukin-13 n=1 Tax=Xyrauchen texanus TaxID=154827 RepID=UPI0022422937|nr:interleukin-13 [Xyrauchen texanus]